MVFFVHLNFTINVCKIADIILKIVLNFLCLFTMLQQQTIILSGLQTCKYFYDLINLINFIYVASRYFLRTRSISETRLCQFVVHNITNFKLYLFKDIFYSHFYTSN